MVELESNGRDARGHLALPDGGAGPAVLVIQEWWGLNPQMKGVADFLAEQGFVALAPDLYHGELAGHDEMDKAGQLMTDLPPDRAARDMSGAVRSEEHTSELQSLVNLVCRLLLEKKKHTNKQKKKNKHYCRLLLHHIHVNTW